MTEYATLRDEFDECPEQFQLDYNTLPRNVKKYWKQRYDLFSKFDEGIYMTPELWFSVTPEIMAIFIAKFIQSCDPNLKTVCDVFCGGGGNTIQLAKRFEKVIGIDINEKNLYCTEKNCEVYNVSDHVELKLGSWIDLINTEYYTYLQNEVEMIFASPPWGGPEYKKHDVFNLDKLEPLPIRKLLESFFSITKNICLFLPKNSDVGQLAQITRELLGPDARCRVIYAYMWGYIKGIFVFWGDHFMPLESSQIVTNEESTMYDEDFYDEKPKAAQYNNQNYHSYQQEYNEDQNNAHQEENYDENFPIDQYPEEDYHMEDYETTYNQAYDNGYEEGYNEGYERGKQEAYERMKQEAYEEINNQGESNEEEEEFEEGEEFEKERTSEDSDYEGNDEEFEGGVPYEYDTQDNSTSNDWPILSSDIDHESFEDALETQY